MKDEEGGEKAIVLADKEPNESSAEDESIIAQGNQAFLPVFRTQTASKEAAVDNSTRSQGGSLRSLGIGLWTSNHISLSLALQTW